MYGRLTKLSKTLPFPVQANGQNGGGEGEVVNDIFLGRVEEAEPAG